MINAYNLDDNLFNIMEYIEIYIDDLKEMPIYTSNKNQLLISKDKLENNLDNFYKENGINFKKIKRKKTTSYVFNIEEEEVKITIRYTEDGNYRNHKFVNFTFNRDFEFYVE